MIGYSPGFNIHRDFGILPMCPTCPRYNVVKTAPLQNNCLSNFRQSARRSEMASRAKRKRVVG